MEEELKQEEAIMEASSSNEVVNPISKEDKTFNKNKWLFACGGVGRDMLYVLVTTYFLQYVQFGLSLTVAQYTTLSLSIGILGRIWDGINDPMMGALIDGSHFKWGKFKPWIFWGAVLDAIFTLLLFNLRPSGWTFVLLMLGVYLLWEAAFTMNDIGYWSMIPSLSRSKSKRDKLTTLTIFFAGLGSIIMTALVTLFAPGNLLQAYSLYSILAAVCVVGCQTMTSFGVKEAPREESETNPNEKISLKKMVKTIARNKQLLWMSLALFFYTIGSSLLFALAYNLYYLEVGYDGNMIIFIVVYGVCNTFVQLIYPKMAKKWGRQKIQTISLCVIVFGYLGLAASGWGSIPFSIWHLVIFALPVFCGSTWFYTATLVNMSNCVEYNDYLYGERQEAVISTMRPLIVKFSDAVKYGIVTLVLVSSGLYAISQNVSSLEGQVNQFKKATTAVERTYYVTKIQEYNAWIDLEKTKGDEADLKSIYTKIDNDIAGITDNALTTNLDETFIKSMGIQGQYVDTIADGYILKFALGDNTDAGIPIVYDKVSDFSVLNFTGDDDAQYLYKFTFAVGGESYNVANIVYKSQKTTLTRIIIRFTVTILPAALYFLSWLLQKKKYIINEEYFDNMMKEIEDRNKKKELELAEETKE